MTKRSATCPKCGRPSNAKVACVECRRSERESQACSSCGRVGVAMSRGVCTKCRHYLSPPGECSQCGRFGKIAARVRMVCGTCQARERRARLGAAARSDLSRVCDFCSGTFVTKNHRARFCSLECANRDAAGWSRSKELAVVRKPRVWFGHIVDGGKFTSGPCGECGDAFTARGDVRYCGDRCSKRASWRRRYERREKFVVADHVRLGIYERDGWTCQLCFRAVDADLDYTHGLSATLDHVVPQSHQLVPDHSPSNLRLAHRLCNSLRGDGSREVDYGSRVEALRDVCGVPASPS